MDCWTKNGPKITAGASETFEKLTSHNVIPLTTSSKKKQEHLLLF